MITSDHVISLLWPLEPGVGVLPLRCTPQDAHTAPLVLLSPDPIRIRLLLL